MLILGIDPGSIHTGYALINAQGNKINYVESGVLSFDQKSPFMERTSEIKEKFSELIKRLSPDEISLESLIYVKSPTALIKLSQTRGIFLGEMAMTHKNKIFEYAPNFIKSSTVGHGHANKESVQKFLDMMFGKKNYKTHDESDALAIAVCHALNRGDHTATLKGTSIPKKSGGSRSLKNSLSHKIGSL